MSQTERSRESRLRRLARKQDLIVRKSRAVEGLDNFGGYMLVDLYSNFAVAGFRYDLDLDGVEEWLSPDLQAA